MLSIVIVRRGSVPRSALPRELARAPKRETYPCIQGHAVAELRWLQVAKRVRLRARSLNVLLHVLVRGTVVTST